MKSAKASVDLLDNVKSGIVLKCFGYAYAFRRLMVFEQGCNDAGQGQGAAVEGVDELHVAVFVFEAQLQTVGLEGLEVGDRADFQC